MTLKRNKKREHLVRLTGCARIQNIKTYKSGIFLFFIGIESGRDVGKIFIVDTELVEVQ